MSRGQIVAQIRKLHAGKKPLNISAVKHHSPRLLESAFAQRPFLGWRGALQASGIDYQEINVELAEWVSCLICGKELRSLAAHLQKIHEETPEDYLTRFPGAELTSEEVLARRSRFQYFDVMPHWEPLWTAEYILDRLHAYHKAGFPIHQQAVADYDNSLAAAAVSKRMESLGGWRGILQKLGLKPDEITRNPQRKKWDPPKASEINPSPYRRFRDCRSVLKAIRQRKREGKSLACTAVEQEDFMLASAARRFFRDWKIALKKISVDPQSVKPARPRKYPDAKSAIREAKSRFRKGTLAPQKTNDALGNAARRIFGSWDGLLEAAGIDPLSIRKRKPNPYVDAEAVKREILRRLRDGLGTGHGAVAKGKQRDGQLLRTAMKIHGDWDSALRAAGLDPAMIRQRHRNPYRTAASVVRAIKKRKKLGNGISYVRVSRGEHRENNLIQAAKQHFGNWDSALSAAGFDPQKIRGHNPNPYRTKKDVIHAVRRRHQESIPISGTQLVLGEHRDNALYLAGRRLFGRWSKVLAAAGLNSKQKRAL